MNVTLIERQVGTWEGVFKDREKGEKWKANGLGLHVLCYTAHIGSIKQIVQVPQSI